MTPGDVGILSVGTVLLIACVTGFWALLKAIGAKFDSVSTQITTNVSALNNAITELRVSHASVTARQDSLESFVRNLPALLAQLINLSPGNQPMGTTTVRTTSTHENPPLT